MWFKNHSATSYNLFLVKRCSTLITSARHIPEVRQLTTMFSFLK